jgi:alkanesulfonate monooxygenase SsuD/methylene tetrahydromethanopterin reductase-like flavin-dependent oxidoreductase (luciferase family)
VVRASPCRASPADHSIQGGLITDGTEFGIYLPQLAIGFEDILDRALCCESLGYDSFWLYDHLYGPGLPDLPSLEGWTLATALLARTTRLRVGHLVNCNNFRHPAVLAKMATTLDVISGGRLELGLGSGSVEQEHLEAGLPWGNVRERSARLGEALEIITRMFASARTTFDGQHYSVRNLPNVPRPVQQPRPPIHIGGAGPLRTLPLVARYADAWNVPTYALDRIAELQRALDEECERIGRDPQTIRRSIEGVLVIATADGLDAASELARRRYGGAGFGLDEGGFIGTPDQITERIGELVDSGFSTFVFMTHDRASAETLELFAAEVMVNFRDNPGVTQEGV